VVLAILARIKDQCLPSRRDRKSRGGAELSFPINHYLDPELITFIDASDRDAALKELIQTLDSKGKLKSKERFFEALLHREQIVSTGIGMNVAIPHAKLDDYDDFFIAIGVQKGEPLPWDALDGEPVRLILMIGGPSKRQGEYLEILSKLTAIIKHADRRRAIFEATEPSEVLKFFAD